MSPTDNLNNIPLTSQVKEADNEYKEDMLRSTCTYHSNVNGGGMEAMDKKWFSTCANINRRDYLQDISQGDTPMQTIMGMRMYRKPLKWLRRNHLFQ